MLSERKRKRLPCALLPSTRRAKAETSALASRISISSRCFQRRPTQAFHLSPRNHSAGTSGKSSSISHSPSAFARHESYVSSGSQVSPTFLKPALVRALSRGARPVERRNRLLSLTRPTWATTLGGQIAEEIPYPHGLASEADTYGDHAKDQSPIASKVRARKACNSLLTAGHNTSESQACLLTNA